MKIRRISVTVLVAAGFFAMPALTAGPAAASPPVKASGRVTCYVQTGSGTVEPGLTPAGKAGGVKINFTGKFASKKCESSVTKPKGDQVVGGSFSGTGYFNGPATGGSGSSCSNFDGGDIVGRITVTIRWITTGAPIAPTTIAYANNSGTVSGSPTDTIALNAPPGTATKSGSFNSASTPAETKIETSLPGPSCGAGPFSSFTISFGDVQV